MNYLLLYFYWLIIITFFILFGWIDFLPKTKCKFCENEIYFNVTLVEEHFITFSNISFTILGLILSTFIFFQDSIKWFHILYLTVYILQCPGIMAVHFYKTLWSENITLMSILLFISMYYLVACRNQFIKGMILSLLVLIEGTFLQFSFNNIQIINLNQIILCLVLFYLDCKLNNHTKIYWCGIALFVFSECLELINDYYNHILSVHLILYSISHILFSVSLGMIYFSLLEFKKGYIFIKNDIEKHEEIELDEEEKKSNLIH